MSSKLYVGNLPFSTTEEALNAAFSAVGTVDSVKIITDRDTGRSKGFAFVEMATDDQAALAIEKLNGQDVGGRSIKVTEANPRPERPAGGGFRGNAREGGFRGGNRDSGGNRGGNRW